MDAAISPQACPDHDSPSALCGEIDLATSDYVRGWALNRVAPERGVRVSVYSDGEKLGDLGPSDYRDDLLHKDFGSACHGFVYPIPHTLRDGKVRRLDFLIEPEKVPLKGSPVEIGYKPESAFVPYSLTNLVGNRVLLIAPHPDDEVLACGGSLTLHRRAGDDVKVVVLTDGAQGGISTDFLRLSQVRKEETLRGCEVTGVKDVEFWGQPDRGLAATEELVHRLAFLIDQFNPTLIYTAAPADYHPDHQAAAALLWKAIPLTRAAFKVAIYELTRTLEINALVDISSVVERKIEACRRHASQLEVVPYVDMAISLNRYRAFTVSSQCTHAEGFYIFDPRVDAAPPSPRIFIPRTLTAPKPLQPAPKLVSILIRTRNRPELLRDSVKSVIAQTYPNIEIILVNDGGASIEPLLKEFGAAGNIRAFEHTTSRGAAAAANSALTNARGYYVNFLDDDDILYPHHVERLVEALEKEGLSAAYSDCEIGTYVDADSRSLREPLHYAYNIEFDRDRLHYENFIPIQSMMFTRELAQRVGAFDEEFECLEDWDYWIRLARFARPLRVPILTSQIRHFARVERDWPLWRRRIIAKHAPSWVPEWLDHAFPRLDRLEKELSAMRLRNQELTSQLRIAWRERGITGFLRRVIRLLKPRR